jgi:hypothetical protein
MKQKSRKLTQKQRESRALDALIALCLHPRFEQINTRLKKKLVDQTRQRA